MNETVETLHTENPFQRWWKTRSFVQKRLLRFCLSMLVMITCFPLYYAGFFGTVEGPLNPSRIGESLAGLGVTRTHSLILFTSFLVMSVTWNWIFNLASIAAGSRLTCTRRGPSGRPCGERVERLREGGDSGPTYVCRRGHRRPDAHFHPVKKGSFSHTLWLVSLVFCVIVFASAFV